MASRTNESDYSSDPVDVVDVAPGVPTDRVRWGSIMAGAFAALTVLAIMGVLGTAIGLSAFNGRDDARYLAVGAGIWGVISMIVAFAFGGWLAARSSAVRGRDNGLLNGFMVAGVGIPILLLAMGSASVLMGSAEIANDRDVAADRQIDGDAQQASAVLASDFDQNTSAASARNEEARDAGQRTAWGTLIALVLAIGAASMAGLLGARDEHHRNAPQRRHPNAGTKVVD